MAISQFDVLNAVSTRLERGYKISTDDDVADELRTNETSAVTRELEIAARSGLVRHVGREATGAPRYKLTDDGERMVVDGLNK